MATDFSPTAAAAFLRSSSLPTGIMNTYCSPDFPTVTSVLKTESGFSPSSCAIRVPLTASVIPQSRTSCGIFFCSSMRTAFVLCSMSPAFMPRPCRKSTQKSAFLFGAAGFGAGKKPRSGAGLRKAFYFFSIFSIAGANLSAMVFIPRSPGWQLSGEASPSFPNSHSPPM